MAAGRTASTIVVMMVMRVTMIMMMVVMIVMLIILAAEHGSDLHRSVLVLPGFGRFHRGL